MMHDEAARLRMDLRQRERWAERRLRQERLLGVLPWAAWGLAIGLLVLLIVARIFRPVALAGPEIACGMAAAAALAALGWSMRRADPVRVREEMDRHAGLADGVVSAGGWAETDSWRVAQLRQTVGALGEVDWRAAWPLRRPRRLWLPLASAVLLVAVLGQWRAAVRARLAEESALALQEQRRDWKEEAKALEEVFQDWEKVQEKKPDPMMEELLKQVQPLREQLAAGSLTEKEALLALSRVQDRLSEMQRQLEGESLEPMADELAEAMESLDQAGALAAALRRRDFQAAQQEAENAAAKLRRGESAMPAGDQADAASGRMEKIGKQFQQRGNERMERAMRQMSDGARQGDRQRMGNGMESLSQGLSREAGRRQQGQSLAFQAAQMQAAKEGMRAGGQQGNGAGQGKGGPPEKGAAGAASMAAALAHLGKLSDHRENQPGSGAGTENAKDKYGEETSLDATRGVVGLSGTTGAAGPSEISVERSSDAQRAQTSSGREAVPFAAYEQMSQQAIKDESIPSAQRQVIKRYFEAIRPGGN